MYYCTGAVWCQHKLQWSRGIIIDYLVEVFHYAISFFLHFLLFGFVAARVYLLTKLFLFLWQHLYGVACGLLGFRELFTNNVFTLLLYMLVWCSSMHLVQFLSSLILMFASLQVVRQPFRCTVICKLDLVDVACWGYGCHFWNCCIWFFSTSF